MQSSNFIPTLNKMGFMTVDHSSFRKAFIEYAQEHKTEGPVLDIGCAYGVVPIQLAKNKVNVTACDAEPRHLEILAQSLTREDKPFVTLTQGILPDSLSFKDNSFQSILATSVFHFLSPDAITKSFHLIYQWLKPGGKFFMTLCSPYQKNLVPFIKIFNERKNQKCLWPGEIEDYSPYALPEYKDHVPSYFHVMDTATLQRVAEESHFIIETLSYFMQENTKDTALYLDGRESVGIICRKP